MCLRFVLRRRTAVLLLEELGKIRYIFISNPVGSFVNIAAMSPQQFRSFLKPYRRDIIIERLAGMPFEKGGMTTSNKE